MNRAIVLVLCLASAGGIVVYTQYSRGETGEPVYTVPLRPSDTAPRSPAPPAPKAIEPGDRAALARELQRELKRVGCYSGEISGVWTTSSRMAMKAFIERVNATLPIDTPDPVLLSLVRGHQQRACGAPCPTGQTAAEKGACVPDAVLAKAVKEAPDDKSDADKSGATLPAAGTAGAMALAVPAAVPKTDPKASQSDGGRPAAASGPVPSEGMRRPRRSAEPASPRPPKVVRDFLKALGFK